MEHAILGLDIGGTSIKAGILLGGQLQAIRSIPTPAFESQEVILESLATFIESYLPFSFEGIGIGIPGLEGSADNQGGGDTERGTDVWDSPFYNREI